jgi:hypothetical protein
MGSRILATLGLGIGLGCMAACASTASHDEPVATKAPDAQKTDKGEIIGTPAPNSKFAKLTIGMTMAQVQDVMDHAPDRTDTHETGKRWIPFYFGTDARRLEALYKGEGCLSFTGGNVWGGSGGELVRIEVSPSGSCFEP